MTTNDATLWPRTQALDAAADRAARAIPPVWPLASSVAVNPYLGQASESLAMVGARLQRIAGQPVTMPRSWYQAKIASGAITDRDLAEALAIAPTALRPASVAALKAAAQVTPPVTPAVPTIADLAAAVSGIDWPGLIAERFGAWAGGYFDEGQALWAAPRGVGAYAAWRAVATHDLTPEIIGLAGFAAHVSRAPERTADALADAVEQLGLPEAASETYFHQMLISLGGWSQYARYLLWQAELGGKSDATVTDFLSIRLIWETALYRRYAGQIADQWRAAVAVHSAPVAPDANHVVDAVLQEAADRAAQRDLAQVMAAPETNVLMKRPALQAAF